MTAQKPKQLNFRTAKMIAIKNTCIYKSTTSTKTMVINICDQRPGCLREGAVEMQRQAFDAVGPSAAALWPQNMIPFCEPETSNSPPKEENVI